MKPTPKAKVQKQFGTRKDLVDAIIPLVDGTDEDRRRLSGTTNQKLLRIHETAIQAKERFGGKSGLIDACEKLQFPNGKANPGWREKMEGWTVKRLLDHHRQLAS